MHHVISGKDRRHCLTQMRELERKGLKFERMPMFVYWHSDTSLKDLRSMRISKEEWEKYFHGYFTEEMQIHLGVSEKLYPREAWESNQ
jgi:hypothetical protein